MDGLNLRSAVAGVALIAVLVLVALFDSSESESDEPTNDLHAFRNDLIESGYSSWITGVMVFLVVFFVLFTFVETLFKIFLLQQYPESLLLLQEQDVLLLMF